MSEHQPSSGDFNREHNALTDLIRAATTYSGIKASPEEHEKVLLRIYGPDRLPGTESRRRSNMGLNPRTPKPHGACEECGKPLTWGLRFCSQGCWLAWREDQKPDPPTREEMIAEMEAALADLRAYIEEQE